MAENKLITTLLHELQQADDPVDKAAVIAEMSFTQLEPDTALVARRCIILRWFDAAIIEALLPSRIESERTTVAKSITDRLATVGLCRTTGLGIDLSRANA